MDVLWIWAETFVRWLHVLAGIAWMGSSFYFIATDHNLRPRPGLPEGAHGETWQVHGGGFYQLTKYLVAPAAMPEKLTWFKWEAYTTWLSGAALMALVYYMGAELYLVNHEGDVGAVTAIAISVGGVIAGWAVYDLLCRSALGARPLALMLVGFALLIGLHALFAELLSARGAFMQMGVIIGTVMAGNVAMVIIPNQRKATAALMRGETPDPALGAAGKLRSLHNNYLSLPVVFVMIGGHYPLAYATPHAGAIFALVIAVGVLVRHFFNTRHQGKPAPWWTWGAAAACVAAMIALSADGPDWARSEESARAPTAAPASPLLVAETAPAPAASAAFEAAVEVVESRCSMCHASEPVWDGVPIAPKGVRLESADEVRRHGRAILEQAVWSRAMPPGNVTEMPPEERLILARWWADAR